LGQNRCSRAALAAVVALVACSESDRPTLVARDPDFRAEPVYLYAAADSTRPPRAVVFFFGNDIGFWRPHRQLAASLAASQYGVAGFDMRPLLRSLPDRAAQRDSAFAARIEPIIAQARHELGGDTVPLIIAGHSLGAEIAIWTAGHVCPPGGAGVLALSPGSRSHLRVSLSDIMNGPEPTGPESFSVPAAIAAIPPDERVAIIRGARDDYVKVDPALMAAGGSRIARYEVPFSGHSLKQLVLAKFEVRRALDWLLDDRRMHR
jgi:pimeloyl-ACP methyl ester carboxylesterase